MALPQDRYTRYEVRDIFTGDMHVDLWAVWLYRKMVCRGRGVMPVRFESEDVRYCVPRTGCGAVSQFCESEDVRYCW